MLAIARALVLNPRILLLDEPLEGLAPIIVEELLAALRKIIREEGMAAIVVEQKARKILGLTDRAAITRARRHRARGRQRRAEGRRPKSWSPISASLSEQPAAPG